MFEVDREGLRKLLARRGIEFALFELVQNAWDQNVTEVYIRLTKAPGERTAVISVIDDDPDGFADIRHAYTLFAESAKTKNPKQRGRFNLGEKLVIAACIESMVVSTKGAFRFVENTRRPLRRRQERGSLFEGKIRMTNEQYCNCIEAMSKLIPPSGIKTYFNDQLLAIREPVAVIPDISLRTEIADNEGYLRATTRVTDLHIHAVRDGEVGTLYEMGIPVVETGDDYHVDIGQKVPLNIDRDNVPPSYLRAVRTAVVNELYHRLTPETANHLWVASALEDPNIEDKAVASVIVNRFGEKAVAFDVTDLEANKLAILGGYTVVHGRSLSKEAWQNVRRAKALPSAGSVTPSPKPFSADGKPLRLIAWEDLSETEKKFLNAVRRIGMKLLGVDVRIDMTNDVSWGFLASYGKAHLTLNRGRLGKEFFTAITEPVIDLLLHEFSHHDAPDHLSHEYYDALTRLGAKLVFLVARDPSLLDIEA